MASHVSYRLETRANTWLSSWSCTLESKHLAGIKTLKDRLKKDCPNLMVRVLRLETTTITNEVDQLFETQEKAAWADYYQRKNQEAKEDA